MNYNFKLARKSFKSLVSSPQSVNGWATLELVMLLPIIVGLIGLVFYFGQLSFLKLHLTSVTDAATRIAAIKDCSKGREFVQDSFSSLQQLTVQCSGDEYITMTVSTTYHSTLPFFNLIERDVKVVASALKEKKLSDQQ